MTRVLARVTLLPILAALAACAGAEAEPRTSGSPTTTAPEPTLVESCEAFFTRARECTDTYIPALVDLRIELDKPAGIAAFAQEEGRDAVIAKAMTEWAEDSQPAAIRATCERLAPTLPPDQVDAMKAQAQACYESADCAAFGVCSAELQRGRVQAGP